MAESIGSLYSTKVPAFSDVADIQEAFRIYHYGAPSGTGTGEYDTTNVDPANLVNPSIAYTLHNLQTQISTLSGSLGVQATVWNAKGAIVTATAASILSALSVGSNGQVLTANNATATGLQWATPDVTLVNVATLSNKTISLGANTITGTLAQFNAALTDDDFVTAASTTTLSNKTILSPTITGSGIFFEGITADTKQTLLTVADPTSNRTITFPDSDGTVVTTGNLASITAVGTVTSGSFPAANISGTTLASNVTASSLTSVGTLGSLNVTGNIVYHTVTNAQAASYTLVLADDGKILEVSNASANTVTIPLNSSVAFPVGTQIMIVQTGAGQTIVAGASGVTVNGTPGLKLRTQWSSATIIKRATDTWLIVGDLVA